MGLMDKSLDARRVFSATNKRMMDALNELHASGDTELLDDINILMSAGTYEALIAKGLYKTIKRSKNSMEDSNLPDHERRRSGER